MGGRDRPESVVAFNWISMLHAISRDRIGGFPAIGMRAADPK